MEYLAHISEDGEREQTLEEHLKNTAEMAGQFASEFGGESWGYCAGMVHDVGKASEEFQQRLKGGRRVDHSTAGMKLLLQKGGLYSLLAPCVAGHHSGMPDWGSEADCSGDSGTVCARKQKNIPDCHLFTDKMEIPQLTAPKLERIGKGGFSVSFFMRMIFSCLVDADYLDTEKFMQNEQSKRSHEKVTADMLQSLLLYVRPWLSTKEEDTINGHRTKILRSALEKGKGASGIYTMTVPTGGGKTVSSLAFALTQACTNNQDRIIYVIPYTSIIEQNAQVFRDILGNDAVLEHHSNVEYESREELHPFQLAAENWDKPVIVTTNVQFFESFYSNRPSKCRKLHNIANSVIIFDEAQKIPTEYLKPCVRVMEELAVNYGCTILLCTATQPSLQNFFSGRTKTTEICPCMEEQFHFFKRTEIKDIGTVSETELADLLANEKQALCICNSRRRAQKIYGILEEKNFGSEEINIYHLSTLMYPCHRMRILKTVRERLNAGKGCILIATSLVEAGVDIDFQTVYREISGIDSIIQAAGRCNREGKRPLSESATYVFSFTETTGVLRQFSQPIAVTKNVMGRFSDISSLNAIAEYFRQMHHLEGDNLDRKSIVSQFDSQSRSNRYPYKSVSDQFKLIEDETMSVLINMEGHAKELANRLKNGEHTKSLMRELQQYEVQIYKNDFDRLYGNGLLEFIDGNNGQMAVLKDPDRDYSEETGLKIDVKLGDAIIW